MRAFALLVLLAAGCAGPPPTADNIVDGRGYCPICVEWHPAAAMRWPLEHQGKIYRFCDLNCRAAFERDPEKYFKDPAFKGFAP